MIGDPRRPGKLSVPGKRAMKIGRLERTHVEKALPTAGSRLSLQRHRHNVFALFDAGSREP